MDGHQAVLLPSRPQRQSGTGRSSSQVGTSRPPARWATTVSEVITRSHVKIDAGDGVDKIPSLINEGLTCNKVIAKAARFSCSEPALL